MLYSSETLQHHLLGCDVLLCQLDALQRLVNTVVCWMNKEIMTLFLTQVLFCTLLFYYHSIYTGF